MLLLGSWQRVAPVQSGYHCVHAPLHRCRRACWHYHPPPAPRSLPLTTTAGSRAGTAEIGVVTQMAHHGALCGYPQPEEVVAACAVVEPPSVGGQHCLCARWSAPHISERCAQPRRGAHRPASSRVALRSLGPACVWAHGGWWTLGRRVPLLKQRGTAHATATGPRWQCRHGPTDSCGPDSSSAVASERRRRRTAS